MRPCGTSSFAKVLAVLVAILAVRQLPGLTAWVCCRRPGTCSKSRGERASRVRCGAEESNSWLPQFENPLAGSMADPGYWKQCLLTLILASGSVAGVPSTFLPFRPFRLLTVDDAMRIMEDGNLNVRHLSQGKDMATRLAAAVNAAVWNIHRQLTSTGEYTQATAPLQEPPGAPIATGEALSPQTLEAVEWGFAKIPSVFKLAVVGGCCGGKTKSRKHIGAALRENDRRVEVFATPEIATVLFHQGAMSNGSFADFVAEEYKEFMVQSEILQFVFEGIWAQGAALSSPSSSYAVLMTDRDALDGRSYSRPLASWAPIGWSTLLDETGKRISIPDLTESDLEQRYEIGAVFWHSLANTNGKLNALGYERECQKPTRHESAQEAFDNDVNASKVYEDGYPTDRIIWIVDFVQGRLSAKDPTFFPASQVQPWASWAQKVPEAGLMIFVVSFAPCYCLLRRPAALRAAPSHLLDEPMLQYYLASELKQFLPPNRKTITAMQLAPEDIKYVGYLAPDKEKSPNKLTEYVILGPVSDVLKYEFKNQCEVYAVNPSFRQWQKDVDKVIPRKDVHIAVVAAGTAKRLGKKILIQGLAQVSAALTAEGRALLVCDAQDEEVLGGKMEELLEAQEWKDLEKTGDLPPDPEKTAALEVLQRGRLRQLFLVVVAAMGTLGQLRRCRVALFT
ncbi:unnamed protein product [Symbiodinium microadriaticum]|nr:unnamed protein product [Symbiodinium microadriaticum]